ncbi:MAG: PH domain-containing protein [Eubacteriales bacterium]|nr:PH domain-containing protein [Lachnospiraceae bacterium]MDO5127516.1 PH domain-containing protein [Eubacteriales bacterium]
MKKTECTWYDRKRHLGLPISFTKYYIFEDRFFNETGFFTTNIEEILLYRIRDISVQINLWQKIFGVGTIVLISSDKTMPSLEVKNIKNPRGVKEIMHQEIERMKDSKRIRVGEILDGHDNCDLDQYEGEEEN